MKIKKTISKMTNIKQFNDFITENLFSKTKKDLFSIPFVYSDKTFIITDKDVKVEDGSIFVKLSENHFYITSSLEDGMTEIGWNDINHKTALKVYDLYKELAKYNTKIKEFIDKFTTKDMYV
jgi:hypothetical protein